MDRSIRYSYGAIKLVGNENGVNNDGQCSNYAIRVLR